MKIKHTPAPWSVNKSDQCSIMIHKECGNGVIIKIADVEYDPSLLPADDPNASSHKANAEHIVKCVNAHDELVEALATASAYLRSAAKDLRNANLTGTPSYLEIVAEKNDALIAKLKEETK
jgi:putative intracellular protease/amidase